MSKAERNAEFVRLFLEQKLSHTEIAELHGVSRDAVGAVLRRALDERGIDRRRDDLTHSRNHAVMKAVLVDKTPHEEIRARFGLTKSALAGIIHRWKGKFTDLPSWNDEDLLEHRRAKRRAAAAKATETRSRRRAERLGRPQATVPSPPEAPPSAPPLPPARAPQRVEVTEEGLLAISTINRLFPGKTPDYPILTLTEDQCKYPILGSGVETEFCTSPRERGRYCEYHARLSYVEPVRRQSPRPHRRRRG